MADPPDGERSAGSHVVQFAAIYRRIIECCKGASVLDVGSSLGFIPVMLAEHFDGMSIVGCDNRQEAVACAADLASAAGVDQVAFVIKDVLSSDFTEMGMFDTLTAIHVLEHLDEGDLPTALGNLLHVTARRLIIAVPYEEQVQPLYGHEQAFTPEKLDRWGRWCVETLGGGSYRCEDVSGGLLIVDRPARAADMTGLEDMVPQQRQLVIESNG
jgi:SAM-dependent methyltransferase